MEETKIVSSKKSIFRQGNYRLDVNAYSLVYTIFFAIIGFMVLYPVILLFINSFKVGVFGQQTSWGIENWLMAFSETGLKSSIINTINLTLVRSIIAMIIGIFLAWLIARTDLPGRDWFEFAFWLTFFLPTLPMTQAWILMLDGERGIINRFFDSIPSLSWLNFDIFSWWGIVWVHLVTQTIAIKVMLLAPAFRNMDGSLEEASRICGENNFRTITRILIPIMKPAILFVLIYGIIRGLEAFEVELILGAPDHINVYSTMIYNHVFQDPPKYGTATALGSFVLIIMVPLILLQHWISTKGGHKTITGKFNNQVYRLGKLRWVMFALVLFAVLIMTIAPIIILLISSFMKIFGFFTIEHPWTLRNWENVLNNPNFLKSLKNTLIMSFSTAFLSMFLFSFVAYITVRTKFKARNLFNFITWLPSTVPGIVLSLGMLWLFLSVPIFKSLYGTIYILIIASILAGITVGVQTIKSNMIQLGNELEESSWVHGGSRLYTLRRIVLPIIAPGMVVVGVLSFASAARNTSHVVLLSTSNTQPLSVLQLSYMADGSFEASSVVGIIILLLMLIAAVVVRMFGLKTGK